MSEKLSKPTTPEQKVSPEQNSHQEKETLKHLKERANNSSETSKDELKAIQKSIESAAISGKEYSVGERETANTSTQSITLNRTIKKNAYKKTLSKAQAKLSKPEKTFSKVIHNPTIERASDITAKTAARPSGILLGGIGAFLGSLIIFIISRRTGFAYNFLVFLIIFVLFYIFGIVLEFFLQLIKRRSQR